MGTPPVMPPSHWMSPIMGGPFGRHAAMWLFHFMSRTVIKQLLEDRFIFIGETDEEEELCQTKEEDPIERLNKVPRPPLKGPLKTQLNVKPEKNNKSDKKEKYISGFKVYPDDKYPWLDKDDPRRNMTDREIIEVCRLIKIRVNRERKERTL